MRPQLDLRPGRALLTLGVVGLGSAGTVPAAADLLAAPAPATVAAAPAGRPTGTAISASTLRRNLLLGRRISVSGALRPTARRRVVALQERRESGWVTIAREATTRSGHYRLGFTPPAPGSVALRVRFAGDRESGPALGAIGVVNVYRLAGASWYGPGGRLACGGTLTSSRLGVAHRTLPCGTMVGLRVGSRAVRVPVIDRGPYVGGRDYDLTPATKRVLGFGDTGHVWATR